MWNAIKVVVFLGLFVRAEGGHECMTTTQFGYFVAKCQNLGLTSIPWELPHNVHKLHFENNKIHELTSTPFAKYEKTKQLYLSNNSITTIGPYAFRGLGKLEILDLENNRLTTIPTETLKHVAALKVLNLKNNRLSYIDNYAFAGLTALKELYLTQNRIINVAPESFADLPHLEWFSLQHNLLRTLDERVMQRFDNLFIIRLYNNPWQCDCALRWMKVWLMNIERSAKVNWRFQDNEPMCHSPPHVAGMKFSKVPVEKFACPAHISSIGKMILLDNIGDDVEMDCQVHGDPIPDIMWYKNGFKIHGNKYSRYKITNNITDVKESQLKIVNFDKTDVATYLCVSSNTGGTYNISYNIKLKGYKPTFTQVTTETSQDSVSSFTATTIIAAIAGTIVLIMAIALILGIICCHQRTRSPQFAVKLENNAEIGGPDGKEYSAYEDIKHNDKMYRAIHANESPYEAMKQKRVDYNEPRYCTYISFRSDPSDPDDLTNCYEPSRLNNGCSRDPSHTESTSPLLEGYRMNVPSPRFLEQMYEHNNDYCNTLPLTTPFTSPPTYQSATKRSTSAGSLSNIPPKKPPRLYQSDSPTSENTSFASVVTTPNNERPIGTPL